MVITKNGILSVLYHGAGENPLNHWNSPLRGIITSSLCVSQILTQTNLTRGFQWSKFPCLVNGWRYFFCTLWMHAIFSFYLVYDLHTMIINNYKNYKQVHLHIFMYGPKDDGLDLTFSCLTCKNTEGRCPGTTGDLVWNQIVRGMMFWKVRPGKLTWKPKIVGLYIDVFPFASGLFQIPC